MYAETIDTGATVSVLRAFGPPDVVELDDFAGQESAELGAEGFWTVVKAVHLTVRAGAAVSQRFPRLSWRASETVPFAQAISSVGITANIDDDFAFAVGVQAAGTALGGTIVAPMPELVMLPGWTLTIDVSNPDANDSYQGVRAYLQRYQLIPVADLLER